MWQLNQEQDKEPLVKKKVVETIKKSNKKETVLKRESIDIFLLWTTWNER